MTFGTLRSRVSSEMKRGELTADATAVATAIITAIDYFKRRRFPWNEFAVTNAGVTVPDQTDVTLSTSSRVITIDSLKIHIGQRDYPLTPTPFRSIDAVDSGQWAGYPEMYSFHHDMIRLYPIPNASYTIAVAGIWDLTELSASASNSATNAWSGQGSDMIRLRAKGNLFRDEIRQFDIAQALYREAEMLAAEIHRETIGRHRSRLIPTQF